MLVTEQLNAARGRLKVVLHQYLWAPAGELLVSTCECKNSTFFDYNLDIWPVERAWQKMSATEIPGVLPRFSYTPPPEKRCSHGREFESVVRSANSKVKKYFDGLCLDCMDGSKSKDVNMDYCSHNEERKWDLGCRISHGQPTWFYSFMGRKEKKNLV